MRNVDLQNVLSRYPGAAEIALNGDLSIDGSILARGDELAELTGGKKGADGVTPITATRRSARSSSARKRAPAKKSAAKKSRKK